MTSEKIFNGRTCVCEQNWHAKAGAFTVQAAADSRRTEFDIKNEVILAKGLSVDFVFIGDSIIRTLSKKLATLNNNGIKLQTI